MSDWVERADRAQARFADGQARLPEGGDERQRQLTRMGNAAWAAGVSYLMAGRGDQSEAWLRRAAETYRRSWDGAPPGSWGRPIGAMKSRLLAADRAGASADARWALDADAEQSETPVGRYAAALARLVLGDDERAGELAATLVGRDDFPGQVAEALAALAARDAAGYETAIRALVVDFEGRVEYLEDVPFADTVLALQLFAVERGLAVELSSPLLPS